MTDPRIDAHQHFWRFAVEDFPWVDDGMPSLKRDWLPHDLRPLLDAQGFGGCIAVQARSTEDETDFLLGLADANPWIAAVVGWVDLSAPDLDQRLDRWRGAPALAGFRHLLQDDSDVQATLDDADFNNGIGQLQDGELVYELLVRGPSQLSMLPSFCARHDRHWLVLDHLGKPAVGGNSDAEWKKAIHELATMPHVVCKLSGLVTEMPPGEIEEATLRPYLDAALDAFGAERVMFGSDWPVCLLRSDYHQVVSIIDHWAHSLARDEQALLWGGNASRYYGLDASSSGKARA